MVIAMMSARSKLLALHRFSVIFSTGKNFEKLVILSDSWFVEDGDNG